MGNFPYPSSYLANGQAILPAYPFREACSFLSRDFGGDEVAHLTALGERVSE